MNAGDFTTAAIALVRTAVGWQSKIAELLGCNPRRVREWLAKDETPTWVDQKIAELLKFQADTPWPRDEWAVGFGVSGDGKMRRYVMHLAPPRFVARAVECNEEGLPLPDEGPADVVTGTVYVADGSLEEGDLVLCEISWIDEPKPGEITHLLEAAADALEQYDDRTIEIDDEDIDDDHP